MAKLRTTKSAYAVRGSDLGKLADLGVKPPVLDFIQVRFVNDVELLTRYFALGESLGGCAYCFPQPLDLANLAAGGNGMSPHLPTGNYIGGGRPPRGAGWVRAHRASPSRPPPASRSTRSPSAPRRERPSQELVDRSANRAWKG